MTSPALNVSSAYKKRKDFELLHIIVVLEQFKCRKTSNLLGFDEFEMLFFLLQTNVMHLKQAYQFSLCRWTVANCKCIKCCNFEDRSATHWAHLSYMGVSKNTQTKLCACTIFRRERSTEKTKPRQEDAGSGNARGRG